MKPNLTHVTIAGAVLLAALASTRTWLWFEANASNTPSRLEEPLAATSEAATAAPTTRRPTTTAAPAETVDVSTDAAVMEPPLAVRIDAAPPEPMFDDSPGWRALAEAIRSEPPGDRKGELIDAFMRTESAPGLSRELLNSLADETDQMLQDHTVLLLQQILEADGADYLVRSIKAAVDEPRRQERFLKVLEDLASPAAMPTVRGLARDPTYTFDEPLLFYSLQALARSGDVDDTRAIFDRVELNLGLPDNGLKLLITAAVQIRNEESLPMLMEVAAGHDQGRVVVSRMIAVYTLRNYRENGTVAEFLRTLADGSDFLASAAREAMTSPR